MLRHIGCVDLLDDELLPRVARLHQENPPEGPLANLPDDRVLFLHCDPVRQCSVTINSMGLSVSGSFCYDGRGLY